MGLGHQQSSGPIHANDAHPVRGAQFLHDCFEVAGGKKVHLNLAPH